MSFLLLGLLTLAAAFAGAALVGLVFVGSAAFGDELVRDPTVKVTDPRGHGSGFYIGTINGRDLYVTAAHVAVDALNNGSDIKLEYTDGQHADKNEVIVFDAVYDFAIIQSHDNIRPPQPLTLNCGAVPTVGTAISAWGYPADLPEVRSSGTIASGVQAWGDWSQIVMTDMSVAPGSSGGPAIGPDGRVIGIVVGWLAPTGFSAFVPVTRLCQWLGIDFEKGLAA